MFSFKISLETVPNWYYIDLLAQLLPDDLGVFKVLSIYLPPTHCVIGGGLSFRGLTLVVEESRPGLAVAR